MIAITNANFVLETGILWEVALLVDEDKILAHGADLEVPTDAQVEEEISTIVPGKKANLVFIDPGFRVQKVMLLGEFVE